jgi:hypothetical protein
MRRALAIIALLVWSTAIGCQMNDRPRPIHQRARNEEPGTMNQGDWPQSETGSPSAGVPPL